MRQTRVQPVGFGISFAGRTTLLGGVEVLDIYYRTERFIFFRDKDGRGYRYDRNSECTIRLEDTGSKLPKGFRVVQPEDE